MKHLLLGFLLLISTPLIKANELINNTKTNSTIIPLKNGITLASTNINEKPHTIAVIHDFGGLIAGIDLTKMLNQPGSPIQLYQQFGYDTLATLIAQASPLYHVKLTYNDLLSPAGTGFHHIALGLNYRKHADEVGAEYQ
ncbi:hypothetical protein [Marinibactrum halimedae]|uniref:Uncharacterized protein n=1 Tax=Marinibactrum halimedae TaxID=1444977 RepID=A0AA37WKC2_9GAMM|nr:hypothetical protein [Marinibactrum halimedae]MCD9461031.1 hypothetical protein [Marinibactrum halimedae]GLS24409.1 hypothetical protein GCM10007877_01200 [Marinibactrum halimedae]